MKVLMAIPLDLKQIISFEEHLISQVIQQEALIRLVFRERNIYERRVCRYPRASPLHLSNTSFA